MNWKSKFPSGLYSCGNSGCPQIHEKEEHFLFFHSPAFGATTLHCSACHKEWKTLWDFVLEKQDGLHPYKALLFPAFAIIAVGFLPWSMPWKIGTLLLSLLSLWKPFQRARKISFLKKEMEWVSLWAFPDNYPLPDPAESQKEAIEELLLLPGMQEVKNRISPFLRKMQKKILPALAYIEFLQSKTHLLETKKKRPLAFEPQPILFAMLSDQIQNTLNVVQHQEVISDFQNRIHRGIQALLSELQDLSFLIEEQKKAENEWENLLRENEKTIEDFEEFLFKIHPNPTP